MKDEQLEQYRAQAFGPPGRTGIFARAFFYGYHLWVRRFTDVGDGRALLKTLGTLVGLGGLCLLLLAGSPADFYRAFRISGYTQPSLIYGVGDEQAPIPIAEVFRGEKKTVIEIDEEGLETRVARSFIANEDTNFLSHPGVDIEGILRAAVENLKSLDVREGASTITQQVARLRFLTNERSLVRKIREAFLAVLLEMRYDKSEIMEIYLNTVPLGHGTLGVESAANFYFFKSYGDLSWGEAAVLTGMTTAPARYSPIRAGDRSRSKVRIVLRKLIENGDLTVAEAEAEYQDLLANFYGKINRSPNDSAFGARLNLHPYATEFIMSQLPEEIKRDIHTGGYRIYTTIVHQHQQSADDSFPAYLREQTARRRRPTFLGHEIFESDLGSAMAWAESGIMFPFPDFRVDITRSERDFLLQYEAQFQDETEMMNLLFGGTNAARAYEHLREFRSPGLGLAEKQQRVEGGLISIRPYTGEITAVVGGSGFGRRNQQLRFLTAYMQPGSAFKPLVYSAAIEWSGRNFDPEAEDQDDVDPVTAATLVDDSPPHYVNSDLSEYSPENYSHTYEGLIRLRRGLALSKNAVAVRVYRLLGPERLNPIINRLLHLDERPDHFQQELPPEASIALGSFAVTAYEMARAYAIFASAGRDVQPYVISHVTDAEGNVVLDNRPTNDAPAEQLISAGTALIITSMLGDVVSEGTGRAAALPGRSVSGKTGTTNRNQNAWFVGYTPNLVTALYIGYDRTNSLGGGATGGGMAAPVWGRYMHNALRGEPSGRFDYTGARVVRSEICAETGMLPGPACRQRMVEVFLAGTQPTEVATDLEGGADAAPPVVIDREDVFDDSDLP